MKENKKGKKGLIVSIICIVVAIGIICIMFLFGKWELKGNNQMVDNNIVTNEIQNTTQEFKRGFKTIKMANNCSGNIFETTYENDVNITGIKLNNKTHKLSYSDDYDNQIFKLNDNEFYRLESKEAILHTVCSYDNHLVISMSNWEGYPHIYVFDKDLKMVYESEGNFKYQKNLLYINKPEVFYEDEFTEITYSIDLKNNSFEPQNISRRYHLPIDLLD